MQRQYVNSSRITSVGYDGNILEVEFKNGKIYHYFNVTYAEYNNFINSASLGSALSILDKKHPYKPIN